jgi:hypothetical protein
VIFILKINLEIFSCFIFERHFFIDPPKNYPKLSPFLATIYSKTLIYVFSFSMVNAIMEIGLNPAQQLEILCYYFNESSEKQIVKLNKNSQAVEVALLPKQGIFFKAMPDNLLKIYRSIFSGREIVDAIRCKALHVCENVSDYWRFQAIA